MGNQFNTEAGFSRGCRESGYLTMRPDEADRDGRNSGLILWAIGILFAAIVVIVVFAIWLIG